MNKRLMNLNIGVNTMGYMGQSWKYRTGERTDVADFEYFVRLTQLAHKGLFDAVFLSDIPQLATGPDTRPFQTLEPITLLTGLGARVPDIGLVATIPRLSTHRSTWRAGPRPPTSSPAAGWW